MEMKTLTRMALGKYRLFARASCKRDKRFYWINLDFEAMSDASVLELRMHHKG
jgi:hypothetical protein